MTPRATPVDTRETGVALSDGVLPDAFRAALDADISRIDTRRVTIAGRALIDAYRSTPDRPSRPPAVDPDAWRAAYLEMRVPATFAAVSHVGRELARCLDLGGLTSLLDLGAGPGTALHALSPWLPALRLATLVDRDEDLLDIAERLATALDAPGLVVRAEQRDIADAHRPDSSDLVVMSYALGEVAPRDRARTVAGAWLNTRQALVIIEPGTTKGFERILEARQVLITRGAHIAAPCPHAAACPMRAPDWCHVPVRVERTRRMRQVKHGDLGYEDEAIAYLIATTAPPPPLEARIVARPRIMKGQVQIPLCTSTGLDTLIVTRRDAAWHGARHARWGERWPSGDVAATAADDSAIE